MLLEVDVEKKINTFSLTASFSLSGKKTGVFGPSGSGKSTLLHILAGLVVPDRGRIVLNGTTLFDQQQQINLTPQQRRIGVVFQHAHLFPHMDVCRNLLYGWRRTPAQERKMAPEAIIKILNLENLLDRAVSRLSGGERQRVALGRTVLSCPGLILLDEPLTGLDENLKFQIIPYLSRVLDDFEIPLLFISHSMEEIRLMTDEVLVFKHGRVGEHLNTEELARRSLASGSRGYANILHLHSPRPHNDLWRYCWGSSELIVLEPGNSGDNTFELGARDITLFKHHPEATSARNLLPCRVTDLFGDGNRIGVELACSGCQLISQIVPESVRELGIQKGSKLVAVIKASAFRRLY